jgi:hypothetical protein
MALEIAKQEHLTLAVKSAWVADGGELRNGHLSQQSPHVQAHLAWKKRIKTFANFDYYEPPRVERIAEQVWSKSIFQTNSGALFFPLTQHLDRSSKQEKAIVYGVLSIASKGWDFSTVYYPKLDVMKLSELFEGFSVPSGPGCYFPGSLAVCSGTISADLQCARVMSLQSSLNVGALIKKGDLTLVRPDTFRPYAGRFLKCSEAALTLFSKLGVPSFEASMLRGETSKKAFEQACIAAKFNAKSEGSAL